MYRTYFLGFWEWYWWARRFYLLNSASKLSYTAILIFWVMERLIRLHRLNYFTSLSYWHVVSVIWNCVALGICMRGSGWLGRMNAAVGLMQAFLATDVTSTRLIWMPPRSLHGTDFPLARTSFWSWTRFVFVCVPGHVVSVVSGNSL